VRACEACYDIATAYRTPFISGKDSLYNESPMGPVTPTLLITAVGIVPDIRSAVSMDLKNPGNLLYLVGCTYPELGGSEYYKLNGFLGKSVPKVRATQAKKIFSKLSKAISEGVVQSCHDLSEGGLAVAAAEMAFAGGFGLTLDLGAALSKLITRNDFLLFSESNSRFLVEVAQQDRFEFEDLMENKPYAHIGEVTSDQKLLVHGLNGKVVVDTGVAELRRSWKKTLGLEAQS
jgi:phosphoribosylformylglycinamidine (FGAM) synthase-like enzyme